MASDLNSYLTSTEALNLSAHLDGRALTRGESFDALTVVAPIGRGATCEVWRVHDDTQHRDLALKIFCPPPGGSPGTLRERFLAEARLLATLDHPNIIRTFGSGTHDGMPYFTTDLLRPLPEAMPPRAIAFLGLDLCRALAHLHARGIIHRDLKPDNVLVAPDGHFVLADLGIAALEDDRFSDFIRGIGNRNPTLVDGHDHALGTPGYAAPEQMSGQHTSPAADIHALGVLFNRLFATRPPLLWRLLIRRMTSSLPAFRPQSIATVRRTIHFIRTLPWLALFFLCALTAVLVAQFTSTPSPAPDSEPKWKPLPPEYIESRVLTTNGIRTALWHIRLPGNSNYTRGDLIRPPTPHYDPASDTTIYHRSRLVIQGPGRFYAPHIAGADVHLISNVTLVTSSEPPTNRYFRQFFPQPIPKDADGTSMLLPRFTIDPGSTMLTQELFPSRT